MKTVTVPVAMPEWVWGRLATIASVQGGDATVETVIADALAETIDRSPRVRPVRYRGPLTSDHLVELETELEAARQAGYRTPHSSRKASA